MFVISYYWRRFDTDLTFMNCYNRSLYEFSATDSFSEIIVSLMVSLWCCYNYVSFFNWILGSPKLTLMDFVSKPKNAGKAESTKKPMTKDQLLKVNDFVRKAWEKGELITRSCFLFVELSCLWYMDLNKW